MKKIVWVVVSSLMVVALLLASCAPAAPPVEEVAPPVEEVAPPGPEVPKYGGMVISICNVLPTKYDSFMDTRSSTHTVTQTTDALSLGDWTRGPAGTGEFHFFSVSAELSMEAGTLAEGWEVPDADTIIIHIRKGVHFSLDPANEASRLVGGREMTVADVIWSLKRHYAPENYIGRSYPGWFQSATKTGDWTITVKVKDSPECQTANAICDLFSDTSVVPPEVYEKYGDMRDWRNSVGTGPFMLVDVVPNSSYTFKKNPNYWMKDPIGPGKGNQLPYVDGVTWLYISDVSTRLAALRTAKVDWVEELSWEDGESLIKTNPELRYKRDSLGKVPTIFPRVDKPELPTYDLRVRKALHMAIDRQAIKNDYFGGKAEVFTWPISNWYPTSYTPLEEMPESVQELYRYNPEKAKQLLAEAGYPNGFKTKILCQPADVDLLSIVAAQWAKIGVELEIDQREYSIFRSIMNAHKHEDMIMWPPVMSKPYHLFYSDPTRMNLNLAGVNDPIVNEARSGMMSFEAFKDQALRDTIMKKIAVYENEQVYKITTPVPDIFVVWQPWVKNYRGEDRLGSGGKYDWTRFIWVDQALKKSMGH